MLQAPIVASRAPARPSRSTTSKSVGRDRHAVFSRSDRVDRDLLDRAALERAERLVQLARRLGQLAAARQPAEERERRLLALGPVERADAAGLTSPSSSSSGERVGVVARRPRRRRPRRPRRRAGRGASSSCTIASTACASARATSAASPLTRTAQARRSMRVSLSSACSSCSRPPLSIEQWMPHSFGAPDSHHQRPARLASPGCDRARARGAADRRVALRRRASGTGTSRSRT